MRLGLRFALAAALVGSFGLAMVGAADDKPKYTIEEVMAKAHNKKSGLYPKVEAGKASADEKHQLVELYEALAKNKAPKGDADSWKTKTTALLEAAKGVEKGDKDAPAKLKKAVNCKACHDLHKE